MELQSNNKLTVTKCDYDALMRYLQTSVMELKYDKHQAEKLKEEITTARIVHNSEFPRDMVRLNSKVLIRNTIARQNHAYTLVVPGIADYNNDNISILAPLGKALLGSRKGDTITLPSARGKRFFTITEVVNPVD